MTVLGAVVFGVTQGLTEFLPISSSAHLILIPWLLRWPDPGLTFDVALHVGTLLAVVAFFGKDWWILVRHGLHGVSTQEGRLFWLLVAASMPGALAGAGLEQWAESTFRHPLLVAILLAVMGLVLYLADRCGAKRQKTESISLGQSLAVGLAQALAIIPGTSRSGVTMAAGLALGLTRESAARLSFLLSTPIVIGAGLFKLRRIIGVPEVPVLPLLIGVGISALTGFLAIGWLLRWLRRSSLAPFAWYRLFLSAGIVAVVVLRGRGSA